MRRFFISLFILLPVVLLCIWFIIRQSDLELDHLIEKYADDHSSFITVDGLDVHIRIEGQGAPLMLLHGTSSSLHTWDGWTGILKDSFQIIRIDLPAFGLTGPNPDRDYSMSFYTFFLKNLTDQLGLDTVYMAGNSFGGRIAFNFASEYPEHVKKLILVDASGFPSKPSRIFRIAKTPVLKHMMSGLISKKLIRQNLEEVYYDDNKISSDLVDRYFELSLRPGNRQAFLDRVGVPTGTAIELLQHISCPTLIMWGAHDTWTPVDFADKFDEYIPDSEVIIYEDSGHVPMEEIPEKSAGDALSFLLGV
jgi:pimeloyl-ACP methyl ester carboxylesterase